MRTKARIAYLEGLVASLEQQDHSSLTKQLQEAETQRDNMEKTLRDIQKALTKHQTVQIGEGYIHDHDTHTPQPSDKDDYFHGTSSISTGPNLVSSLGHSPSTSHSYFQFQNELLSPTLVRVEASGENREMKLPSARHQCTGLENHQIAGQSQAEVTAHAVQNRYQGSGLWECNLTNVNPTMGLDTFSFKKINQMDCNGALRPMLFGPNLDMPYRSYHES
jgi:hypothetical protein